MATRDYRLAEFSQGVPPAGRQLQVLCEDHNGTYLLPFKCEYRDRFKAMHPLEGESEDALGRRFLSTLTGDEVKACGYHASDWRARQQ